MIRLLRGLTWAVVAPLGALVLFASLATLLLGSVVGLLWNCFGIGLDCGRRRR